MVEQAISWCVSILIVLEISYMIYFNVVQIAAKSKCRKKQYFKPFKPCHESGCKFADYCEKYEHVYTDEEIASIEKLIAEMKMKS